MTPTKHDAHGQTWAAAGGANAGDVSTPIVPRTRPNSQASNYLLAQALRYALNGWRVLPVMPDSSKAPCYEPGLIEHGVKDATTDPETIGAWWQRWPAANIGLALDNAHVVLDVDPRHGGKIEDVYKLGVDVDGTPVQRTWSGGWHVLLEKPVNMAFAGKVPGVPGIDVKTDGGYIVAAPSVIDGKPYSWQRDPLDVDPVRIPLDLAERLRKTTPAGRTDAHSGRTAAHSGRYSLDDVRAMLAVLDPWQDGYDYWLRTGMAVHSEFPGDDGLAVWEAWADGKPGEAADKWKSFRKAGVTLGTLIHHARLAGWQPVSAEDADIPERWRITADDWRTCPLCAAHHVVIMSDGSVSDHHRWCRNPKCKVYRKRKIHVALRCVFGWDGVGVETVPADNWRGYRKRANRRWRGNWRGVPIPGSGGDRMVLYETASPTEQLDDILNRALSYMLDNDAIRRARRKATDFLNSLEDGAACDPDTMRKVQEALDVLAGDKTQNLSTPRARRKADDDAQPIVKPERPKPVETVIIARHHHQRAIHDVLNRLNIPWERRAYGGWRTAPLSAAQLLQVKTALVFAVPGAVVPAGALDVGTNAQLDTPWPEDLPHTEREAVLYGIRERVDMQPTYPLRR